jgi:hypothetical protein
MGGKEGRCVAKLVARLLATAALWDRIRTSLKNVQNKQRNGQHTLADQQKIKSQL